MSTNDLSLPALREAVAKMTEGPWVVVAQLDDDGLETDLYQIDGPGPCMVGQEFSVEADAAGIVALRNAAPALLDEVEALRADNRRLYEEDRRIFAELSRTLAALSGQDDPAEAVQQLGPSEYCAELAKRRMADLAAARAVLDGAHQARESPGESCDEALLWVERAAWQRWQAREGANGH